MTVSTLLHRLCVRHNIYWSSRAYAGQAAHICTTRQDSVWTPDSDLLLSHNCYVDAFWTCILTDGRPIRHVSSTSLTRPTLVSMYTTSAPTDTVVF